MESATNQSTQFLQEYFIEKKQKNSQYSLSAFARDLGLSVSFVSRLLRGERPLTLKQVVQISTLLELSETETKRLIQTVSGKSKNKRLIDKIESKKKNNLTPIKFEIERFKMISQWYHLAILSLIHVSDFQSSPAWIAKRLGITTIEAESAIQRLLKLGLIEKNNHVLSRAKGSIFVKTKQSEAAVREFHSQMIDKAKDALKKTEQEAFEARYIAGSTIAIDRAKLPELKERLQKFQIEIAELAKSNQYTDVYHLNLHLFPITNKSREN